MTTTPTIRRPGRTRALALPLIAVAAFGLGACGEDGADTAAARAADDGARQAAGTPGSGGRAGGGLGARTAAEREKLQSCLKQRGVTLPTLPSGGRGTRTDGAPPAGAPGGGLPGAGPTGGGRGAGGPGGTDAAEREKFRAALEACGAEAPAGGRRRGDRPDVDDAAYRESITAYVACVRKNGFDLPDPDFSGDGPIFDPDEVDQSDATFRKASAACRSTLRGPR